MNEGEGKEEKSVKFLRNHLFFSAKSKSFLRQPGSGEGGRGSKTEGKIDSQCESIKLRSLTLARLIRIKQITSDEALSNQLLRISL